MFAVTLVVRDLLIVTSHTNCDVTGGPVVMRRYANADGDEQRYKKSKTQSLTFCKRPRDGRHNSCCSGLQYQPLQRRPYRGQFL